jgi:hypothetical protein
MRALPRLSVSSLIIAGTLLTAIMPIAIVVPSLLATSRSIVEVQASERLQSLARGGADQLGRALNARWRELKALSEFARSREPADTLRIRLEAIKAANPAYAWIGLADAGGRVVVATGRLLEGQNMADRPWFKDGSDGPFAGEPHEAVLLRGILSDPEAEPSRLVDLATPIHRGGEPDGVMGAYITWEWLADLVRQLSKDSGIAFTLVARDGTVVVGPDATQGRQLKTQSAFAARLGTASTTIERREDGSDQLVSVVPSLGFGDLPSFGWSLIASIPAEAAFASAARTTTTLVSALGMSALAIGLGAILLGRIVGRPIARMAVAVAGVASSRFDLPVPDERAYREVADISASLSRVQSKVQALDEPPPEEPRPIRTELVLVPTGV